MKTTLVTIALSMSVMLSSGACLGSALLGALADARIVETQWKNPDGTVRFVQTAERMGCRSEWTNSSLGPNLWLKCPGEVIDLPDAEIAFGFVEDAEYLTVGCDRGDEKYCDGPINKIMAAAM